jgi:hypothetical protein
MVCGRCEMAVSAELKNGAFYSFTIREVEIATDLDESPCYCQKPELAWF